MIDVVIASYKEDPSFVDSLEANAVVYDKGERGIGIQLENVGRVEDGLPHLRVVDGLLEDARHHGQRVLLRRHLRDEVAHWLAQVPHALLVLVNCWL